MMGRTFRNIEACKMIAAPEKKFYIQVSFAWRKRGGYVNFISRDSLVRKLPYLRPVPGVQLKMPDDCLVYWYALL